MPPGRHRSAKPRLPMHKIPPLQALILAAEKRDLASPQLVIKTRVWVAMSADPSNPAQRNHIIARNGVPAIKRAQLGTQLAPPMGAIAAHPEIENLQHCASHTWLSTQATPTTGFR
jgi:hypothetical protein